MSWTIKGESGATLDETSRSLESMLIEQATVKFRSLDVDTFSWSSAIANLSGGGTIVPALGQRVELYWNAVRKFRGNVTDTKVGTSRVTVTVSGPLWWLKNTPLTSLRPDKTGTQSERQSIVFPTQNVAAMIKSLLDRAKALGCPIQVGNIASMYVIPRVTLDAMDCLSALAELLRWVPDAVAWVDYSGDIPKLHVARRGTATALPLSAAESNIESIDIRPRLEMQVKQCSLKYVQRDATTGKPKWKDQTYGTSTDGKRQIITVSGPEISVNLPKDDFESYEIKTADTYSQWLYANDAGVIGMLQETGYTSLGVFIASGQAYSLYPTSYNTGSGVGSGGQGNLEIFRLPALVAIDKNGQVARIDTRYWLLSETAPDWVKKVPGLEFQELNLQATIAYVHRSDLGNLPYYVQKMGLSRLFGGIDQAGVSYSAWGKTINSTLQTVKKRYATKTKIYKPMDYDYLAPPAGLAQNLQAAQDWVPWEGTMTRVFDQVTAASNILGRPLNLTDSLPACADMKALLNGLTYEIQRGRVTYELGAPVRNDYGSLVSRIRRSPKDNIVYL